MAGEANIVRARMLAAAETWAHMVGNDLVGKAARLAPLEEGTLSASGHSEVEVDGSEITVTVSFDTPYAARRHEDTAATIKVGGRQAKYIEQPLKESLPRYEAALQAAINKAL